MSQGDGMRGAIGSEKIYNGVERGMRGCLSSGKPLEWSVGPQVER